MWSGRRDLNPRPRPWQGRALPTELLPQGKIPRTDLLSQDPAVPVPSALARFTAVFGMGTGGSTPLRARGILVFCLSKGPRHHGGGESWLGWEIRAKGSRPRTIGTGQLNASRRLHPRPIHRVFFPGPYRLYTVGGLILGRVSRLDAFSGYPSRTWLPSVCPWRDSWETRGASLPVLSY
jgi:hypothetical protein